METRALKQVLHFHSHQKKGTYGLKLNHSTAPFWF